MSLMVGRARGRSSLILCRASLEQALRCMTRLIRSDTILLTDYR